MSFLRIKPSELRAPETVVLPDDRKRLTRFYGVAQMGVLPPDLDFPWGTLDSGEAPAGWSGLRLTNRQMTDEIPSPGENSRPVLMLIYEQIAESAETPVGGPTTTQLEDGRSSTVDETIQFSSAPYVPREVGSVNPDNPDEYLLKEESVDNGTTRTIKRIYVTAGTIATDEQVKNGGALSIRTITSVKTVPSTPSGYTLIGLPVQNPNGLPIYTYTFAKGEGLVSDTIEARPEGLRVQTWVSLGTKLTPDGIVTRDDLDEQDGYQRFTVSCMQSATGDDPTSGSFSYERYERFLYPGRALAYEVMIGDRTMIDVYQSPPIDALLEADVTITYQSSGALTISGDFWSPAEWATVIVKMIGFGPNPISIVKALPGYRTMSDTAIDYVAPNIVGEEGSVMGNLVYGGTTATLQVVGGPEDPGGETWVVEARLEPAFSDVTGQLYYRKTVVSIDVPAQPDLPSF